MRGSSSTQSPCSASRLSTSGSARYSRASLMGTRRGSHGWRRPELADDHCGVAVRENGRRPALRRLPLPLPQRVATLCEVGKVGLNIPDDLLAALAARPSATADARRSWTCDGYGLQLETACLPGKHISERSSAIVNVITGDLLGASMETKSLFAHVHAAVGPSCSISRARASLQT